MKEIFQSYSTAYGVELISESVECDFCNGSGHRAYWKKSIVGSLPIKELIKRKCGYCDGTGFLIVRKTRVIVGDASPTFDGKNGYKLCNCYYVYPPSYTDRYIKREPDGYRVPFIFKTYDDATRYAESFTNARFEPTPVVEEKTNETSQ